MLVHVCDLSVARSFVANTRIHKCSQREQSVNKAPRSYLSAVPTVIMFPCIDSISVFSNIYIYLYTSGNISHHKDSVTCVVGDP